MLESGFLIFLLGFMFAHLKDDAAFPEFVHFSRCFPWVWTVRLLLNEKATNCWLTIPLCLGIYSAPFLPLFRFLLPSYGFLVASQVLKLGFHPIALAFLISHVVICGRYTLLLREEVASFLEQKQQSTLLQERLLQERETRESTMMRNAMRLAFPENPLHSKDAEDRILEAKLRLHIVPAFDVSTLVPSPLPVPRHFALPSSLFSIKIARYTCQNKQVLVQSIPNLEALESSSDLDHFITTVHAATTHPLPIGIMRTVGFSLEPIACVVEELIDLHSLSLRDLILEVRAEGIKLDWFFAKPLLAALAKTVMELHALKIVHRRISLHTVLITGHQSCVLFPVQFHFAFPEYRRKMYGTALWEVAPEAKQNIDLYTESSDVWAFCVVAWELLVGPFTHNVTHFAMPPVVPKGMVDCFLDGLNPSPDVRPTMQEVYSLLCQEGKKEEEENLVSREVFVRVLERLNAIVPPTTSSSTLPAAAAAAKKDPIAPHHHPQPRKSSSAARVSFMDDDEDEEEENI